MEQRLDYEHRLTEVEDRSKSNQHRLEDLEKRQDNLEELTSTVKVLAIREEKMEADVKEIKVDVKNLTAKPGKRWDNLVETIIGIVVGAFIGVILAQLGM